jgi:hypothetical protein
MFFAVLQLLDRFGIGFSFSLYLALTVSFVVFLFSGWLYYKHGCFKTHAEGIDGGR